MCRRRNRRPSPLKWPFWSFREGWNNCRWLPAWENTDRSYEEVPHHFGVGPLARGLVCGDYRTMPCGLRELVAQLRASPHLGDQQAARRLHRVVRVFMNELDLQCLEDGVKVLGVSEALFDEIRTSLWDLTISEVTHPQQGRNLRVQKLVEGATIRGPEVRLASIATSIPHKCWQSELARLLDDYCVILSAGDQQRVIEGRLDSQDVTGFIYASSRLPWGEHRHHTERVTTRPGGTSPQVSLTCREEGLWSRRIDHPEDIPGN